MKAARYPAHALVPATPANVSGTITLDLNPSLSFFLVLTGNLTVANPTSPPAAGSELVFILVQDNAGAHTVTWDTQFAGPIPAIGAAANAITVFRFLNLSPGVPQWYCVSK